MQLSHKKGKLNHTKKSTKMQKFVLSKKLLGDSNKETSQCATRHLSNKLGRHLRTPDTQ